ncbi:hypothetical protein O0A22_11680 [Staphylococcus pseudintermedius]|nr:hypothetical protein [Staphylococcus pseudintermedius]
MRSNTIELAIQFDSNSGLPIRYNTFVTRPNDITFGLVYECSSFLESLQDNPNTEQVENMIDLVLRAYGEQFDRLTLINGLESHSATKELFNQVLFVATGKNIDEDIEIQIEEEGNKVTSWQDHKNNLRALYQDMVKEQGSSPNDVLGLPFYFVFDDLNKKAKINNHTDSMLEAFGGGAFG